LSKDSFQPSPASSLISPAGMPAWRRVSLVLSPYHSNVTVTNISIGMSEPNPYFVAGTTLSMKGSHSETFLQLMVAGHCFSQGTWAVVQYAAESNNTTVTVLQLDGLELEPPLGTSQRCPTTTYATLRPLTYSLAV
jgi:hypothetical protein